MRVVFIAMIMALFVNCALAAEPRVNGSKKQGNDAKISPLRSVDMRLYQQLQSCDAEHPAPLLLPLYFLKRRAGADASFAMISLLQCREGLAKDYFRRGMECWLLQYIVNRNDIAENQQVLKKIYRFYDEAAEHVANFVSNPVFSRSDELWCLRMEHLLLRFVPETVKWDNSRVKPSLVELEERANELIGGTDSGNYIFVYLFSANEAFEERHGIDNKAYRQNMIAAIEKLMRGGGGTYEQKTLNTAIICWLCNFLPSSFPESVLQSYMASETADIEKQSVEANSIDENLCLYLRIAMLNDIKYADAERVYSKKIKEANRNNVK